MAAFCAQELTTPSPVSCHAFAPHRAPRRYRLAFGTSDKLQTASMVAAFHVVRIQMAKAQAAAS